jgi:hypothetical protein
MYPSGHQKLMLGVDDLDPGTNAPEFRAVV